jgi:exodeoxyribonuclease VII small subunit
MTQPQASDERPSESELDFEQALTELEAVLLRLEQGHQRLEDTLRDYERGLALLRRCEQLLQQAELKVQQLTGWDTAGEPKLEPLPHTSRLKHRAPESVADSQP